MGALERKETHGSLSGTLKRDKDIYITRIYIFVDILVQV